MAKYKKAFYEFFAGGGMARAGLGTNQWRCLFANDFDHKKSRIYRENWGQKELLTGDVGKIDASQTYQVKPISFGPHFHAKTCL
ncbi:MAG: DNA cytosine methyltransferase [Hymenobacter sp.]